MKIKELRLLDITVKQGENVIYQGRTEDLPENIKNQDYKDINFDGTRVIIEI